MFSYSTCSPAICPVYPCIPLPVFMSLEGRISEIIEEESNGRGFRFFDKTNGKLRVLASMVPGTRLAGEEVLPFLAFEVFESAGCDHW